MWLCGHHQGLTFDFWSGRTKPKVGEAPNAVGWRIFPLQINVDVLSFKLHVLVDSDTILKL